MSSSSGTRYEQLSLVETGDSSHGRIDDGLSEDAIFDEALDKIVAVRNDKPFPISRPPPKARDWGFGVLFLLHFAGILLLSLVEQGSLQHSYIKLGDANSWASMLMLVTLVGAFLGAVLSVILSWESSREFILSTCIPFALILKIVIGNILLIMRSEYYSFLGVLVIISALVDTFWYKAAREGVNFTSVLVQMVIDTTGVYGIWFVGMCSVVVFIQTCVLLWWGSFFIGLISTVTPALAIVLILIMAFSLFWITQFFNSLASFIVGGCVMWIFSKDDSAGSSDHKIAPSTKLLLYARCAVTTSLGSVCKSALYSPFAMGALALRHWIVRRGPQSAAGISRWSLRGMVASTCLPMAVQLSSERNHRLALCLTALYGRALGPTAISLLESHRETLDICIEDVTYFLLTNVSVVAAALVAILFGLIAERGDKEMRQSWPLFFFVVYYLTYCGVSLSIHVYSSAVDALIVASAVNPIKFAHENQIVFLRFLRTSETGLR